MSTFNNWDVIGSVTQEFLQDWITAYWYNQSNSGGTKLNDQITISKPTVKICPNPADGPTQAWTSALEFDTTLTQTSNGQSLGSVEVIANMEQIAIGRVYPQSCLTSQGGSGAYVNCGTLSFPDTGYTLMAWINLNSTTSAQNLFNVVNASNQTQFALSIDRSETNGGSKLILDFADGTSPISAQGPSFDDGSWHQVAIVFATDKVTFYIDGQNLYSTKINTISAINDGKLYLGDDYGSGGPLNGQMTGVSVWAEPLTDARILEVMNANPSLGGASSCTGYWLFDPTNPVNLMNPSVKAQALGGVTFNTISGATWETYLYFGSSDWEDIFYVNALSTVQSQVEEKLAALVAGGAISLSKKSTDADWETDTSFNPDVSFFGLITESTGDWSNPPQMFGLAKVGNGVPPIRSNTKTAFATNTILELPADDSSNFVTGIAAASFYEALGKHLENSDDGWSNVAYTATDFSATKTTKKNRTINLTAHIENGKGISFTAHVYWGLLGDKKTWDIEISGVVEVDVITVDGVQEIQVNLSDSGFKLNANADSDVVKEFKSIANTFLYFLPFVTALMYLLAELWKGILYVILSFVLNKVFGTGGQYPLSSNNNFQVKNIIFEDGILVEGELSPSTATVKELSANTGNVGNPLQITGSGFFSDTTKKLLVTKVNVAGVPIEVTDANLLEPSKASFDSATLQVNIPAGSGVATPVQVLSSGGFWSAATKAKAIEFAVVGTVKPTQVALVTEEAIAGDSIQLTCQKGFAGTTAVTFHSDSKLAPKDPSATSFTVKSDTTMSVVVPSGVNAKAAPWTIKVTNAAGSEPATPVLKVYNQPIITAVSGPNGNNKAAVGETVTVTGNYFTGTSARPVKAYFYRSSSQSSLNVNANLSSPMDCTVSDDGQSLTFVATSGAVGNLVIQAAGGYSNTFNPFTITNEQPPEIKSFKPAAGRGKSVVVVQGSNFTGITKVTIGGQNCSYLLNQQTPDAAMTITVPNNPETGAIVAFNQKSDGSQGSGFSSQKWYYDANNPTVTSISKSTASPGETVTISGSGFQSDDGEFDFVKLVGLATMSVSADNYTVTSDSSISVVVPDTGVGNTATPVSVTTYAGANVPNTAVNFYFEAVDAPTIDEAPNGIYPTQGGPGTTLVIKGANFTGITSVTLGGVQLLFNLINDGEVQATVADGKDKLTPNTAYDVIVTNNYNNGSSKTATQQFTYTG